jgi:hypothetical protein
VKTIQEKLDELKRLCDAATPEIRFIDGYYLECRRPSEFNYKERDKHTWPFYQLDIGYDSARGAAKFDPKDAAFIAASRTAMPKLMEAIDAAVYALEEMARQGCLVSDFPSYSKRVLKQIAEILEVGG